MTKISSNEKKVISQVCFFVFLFSCFFVFSACVKKDQPAVNANQTNLEKQYEASLQAILKPYWEQNAVAGVKDKILALKAPAKYLDLHFNLVVAFELIEQGQAEADQAKIEAGLDKVNGLKASYSWL